MLPLEKYPYNFLFAVIYGTHLELPETISKDVYAGIQYAFSTLEVDEQQILRLRYAEQKSPSEATVHLHISEEEAKQIEAEAFRKLRLPGRWNYIRNGVAGFMKKRIVEERRKAYHTGYCDGYQKGTDDARNGICPKNASEEILNIPIENMGLSVHAYNCLRISKCQRLRDVAERSDNEIRKMFKLGPKTADEIARTVQRYGICHSAWDKFIL